MTIWSDKRSHSAVPHNEIKWILKNAFPHFLFWIFVVLNSVSLVMEFLWWWVIRTYFVPIVFYCPKTCPKTFLNCFDLELIVFKTKQSRIVLGQFNNWTKIRKKNKNAASETILTHCTSSSLFITMRPPNE